MTLTEEGLALIRRFEGFRSDAYWDAVGVWTIGYGHTSMAGPPRVVPGLRLTAQEAADILARDAAHFADGVRDALKVTVSDAQFSALVSFAYNVGLGNFRRSSVLKAVNEGRMEAVPRRLALWVKAGGRTLPGLVTRRAAEAALFVDGNNGAVPPRSVRRTGVEAVQGKPPATSRTLQAAIAAACAAVAQSFAVPRMLAVALALVILGAAAFIVYDRVKKLNEEAL